MLIEIKIVVVVKYGVGTKADLQGEVRYLV